MRFKSGLLLPLLPLACNAIGAPAIAFSVNFGAPTGEILDTFPLATITVDPNLLQVGDAFVVPLNIPSRHDSNTDFTSSNIGLPSWLEGSNADALPMAVRASQPIEVAVIFTVISPPTGSAEFSIVGELIDQESLGFGDSRLLLTECLPGGEL